MMDTASMVPFRSMSNRGAMDGSALTNMWYTPYLQSLACWLGDPEEGVG